MKIAYECIPCIVRGAIDVATEVTGDEEKQKLIIKTALKKIGELDFDMTAPVISRDIQIAAREIAGNPDPYKELKASHNKVANEIIEDFQLKKVIAKSDNPIETACKLSIAGNIIDMGAYTVIEREFIEESVRSCLSDEFQDGIMDAFMDRVSNAKNIMFIADNAGEIVFDRLLIELLDLDKVTYVVKGGPIMNDATIVDAQESGLIDMVRVIDTGIDCQGTPLHLCSKEFVDEYANADLIISKGQANYETLSEGPDKDIFYLLKAKCVSIANDIGCNQGKTVMISAKNKLAKSK